MPSIMPRSRNQENNILRNLLKMFLTISKEDHSKKFRDLCRRIFDTNTAGVPWFFSLAGLFFFSDTSLKPLVMVILISPWCHRMRLKNLCLIFSRNLITFTGILWLLHSTLGYFKIESLNLFVVSVVIELTAIQIVQSWDTPDSISEEPFRKVIIAKILFFVALVSVYSYSFFDFPNRLATFLLGWDHLNGHLWLISRTFQEGFIRINSDDSLGIYPKAEFPLILSLTPTSINFQSLSQAIIFVEILVSLAALVALHELTFGRINSTRLAKSIQVCCTTLVLPILIWFAFYGWTSLILTTSALLILTWQTSIEKSKYSWMFTLFLSAAAIQSWTLVAPIVVILLVVRQRIFNRDFIIFFCFFVSINLPSVFAIVNYNGVEQISEGFKSKSLLFFLIFLCSGIPILYLLKYKRIKFQFKVLITCTYIEAVLIWAAISSNSEVPYYAFKLFLMTLVFFIPITAYLALKILRIEKLQLVFIVTSLITLGLGNVPTSQYKYSNFILGTSLKTNWLSENIVSQTAKANTHQVLLHSIYVVDLNVIQKVGRYKGQELFAYDSEFICQRMKSDRGLVVISDPLFMSPICNLS